MSGAVIRLVAPQRDDISPIDLTLHDIDIDPNPAYQDQERSRGSLQDRSHRD